MAWVKAAGLRFGLDQACGDLVPFSCCQCEVMARKREWEGGREWLESWLSIQLVRRAPQEARGFTWDTEWNMTQKVCSSFAPLPSHTHTHTHTPRIHYRIYFLRFVSKQKGEQVVLRRVKPTNQTKDVFLMNILLTWHTQWGRNEAKI
jgi:hypothetical protein